MTTAYPLAWPDGWPRTDPQKRDEGRRFLSGQVYEGYGNNRRYVGRKMPTFDGARKILALELDRLKAKNVVISSDLPLRADGQPYAGAERKRMDPGIAVYFTLKDRPLVMASDAFDNMACNARSLGLAIEALRTLERHGGGYMMEKAFSGFSALPPPAGHSEPVLDWRVELGPLPQGLEPSDLLAIAESRYRSKAKECHADTDGDDAAMIRLNAAIAQARAELKR